MSGSKVLQLANGFSTDIWNKMPNLADTNPATMQATYGEPQPLQTETPVTRRDLASWWKTFKKTSRKEEDKGVLSY